MEIFRTALSDTTAQLGGRRTIFLTIILGAFGLLAHYIFFGLSAMIEEWPPYVSVIGAIAFAAISLFIFNALRAPLKLERAASEKVRSSNVKLREQARDDAEKLEAQAAIIADLRDQRPRLSLLPQSIGYGDNEDMLVFCFFIRVSNAGGRSSSADGWQMNVRFAGPDNETRIPLELWASGTGFTMSSVSGEVVTVPETEYIFNKLVDPLQPGAMIVGALVGACKKEARDSKLAMLEASCVDVLGQTISCEHHVTFDHHDGFRFNPFVKATLGKA